jgi:hypothetical protein
MKFNIDISLAIINCFKSIINGSLIVSLRVLSLQKLRWIDFYKIHGRNEYIEFI